MLRQSLYNIPTLYLMFLVCPASVILNILHVYSLFLLHHLKYFM